MGSKRHLLAIFEGMSIRFVAWWSVQLPLANYNVKIGIMREVQLSITRWMLDFVFLNGCYIIKHDRVLISQFVHKN
jgi:hypothetical protein